MRILVSIANKTTFQVHWSAPRVPYFTTLIGPKFGGEPAGEGGLSDEQEKRIWTLTAHNNQLIKQLNEKVIIN